MHCSLPDSNGNENVEDTDATTPMIEKANAIVSMNYPSP